MKLETWPSLCLLTYKPAGASKSLLGKLCMEACFTICKISRLRADLLSASSFSNHLGPASKCPGSSRRTGILHASNKKELCTLHPLHPQINVEVMVCAVRPSKKQPCWFQTLLTSTSNIDSGGEGVVLSMLVLVWVAVFVKNPV